MAFAKGNQLWKEGLKAKQENKDRMSEFLAIYVNGGFDAYADKLDSLSRKEKLTPEEKLFMDKMEFWAEFVKPKLARHQHTGEDGGPIQQNLTVQFVNPKT
jgi:hypothetical protein